MHCDTWQKMSWKKYQQPEGKVSSICLFDSFLLSADGFTQCAVQHWRREWLDDRKLYLWSPEQFLIYFSKWFPTPSQWNIDDTGNSGIKTTSSVCLGSKITYFVWMEYPRSAKQCRGFSKAWQIHQLLFLNCSIFDLF